MYVFQMFDYQAGGISLVLIAFLEAIGIGWFYGENQKLKFTHLKKLFFRGSCLLVQHRERYHE